MASLNESQLKEQIKTREFSNAYLIYGEETYLKEFYVGRLKDKIIDKDFADFNFHNHEGMDTSMDDILMDSSMLPMVSEYSLVLVHDFVLDNASDLKKLEELLKDVNDSTVLVFWYDRIDIDVKKSKSYGKAVKLFEKYGAAVELNKKTESEIASIIIKGARKRSCNIDKQTALYFISVVGSDLQTVQNELEKICSYINSGNITKKIIDEIAVKSLQSKIYDLSKFILRGNGDAAYKLMNTLFSQKVESVAVLSVLASYYVDMYRVKCAKQANVSDGEIVSQFGYKGREFVVRNASRDSSQVSISALRNALGVLAEADDKIKSTSINDEVILEETVAKLLLLRNT